MNPLKQLSEFARLNSINPLATDMQVLWHNIFAIFNIARWPERLQIKSQTLEHLCQFDGKRLGPARNGLIQRDLIRYFKKKGSASPDYEFVFLGETQTETQTETQSRGQTGDKPGTNGFTPYSENNKRKENKKEVIPPPVTEPKFSYREQVLLTEKEYQKLATDYGEEKTGWMLDKLNTYKLANGKKYKSDYAALFAWVLEAANKSFVPKPKSESESKQSNAELWGIK